MKVITPSMRTTHIWPNICRKLHEYGLGFPLDLEKLEKMRVHLENLEILWNFENFKRNHGKVKPGKTGWVLKVPPLPLTFRFGGPSL